MLLCSSVYAPAIGDDSDKFTLNLDNTDVQSLIKTVSVATGRNFVVDPRVSGRVTVISTTPVDADTLYEMFLSVLQVHGFSAIDAGGLTKIVPDFAAKQGPVPVLGAAPENRDQLVSQVIPVINVPAVPLVPILRPMVPQEGQLAAYPASNSLIITDRAANIERLRDIIKLIDVPDSEEIDQIQLRRASASEIVQTLAPLQRQFGEGDPGRLQLVADERTNSVLVSGSLAARNRARKLISKLDSPIEAGGNTRVVFLHFADAQDIAAILEGIPSGSGSASAVGNTPSPADTVNDNFRPDTDTAVEVAVEFAPEGRAPVFTPGGGGGSTVDIKSDENTNSLIITAPPSEMTRILSIIKQLDIRRPQVLVEAVIAEVTEDNIRELGINFLIDGSEQSGPVGFTNLGGGTGQLVDSLNTAGVSGLPALSSGASFALGSFANGGIDFGLLFRAIASDAENNILSTPTIVTLDNEEAEIVVGSNVPFVTGQQLSANNDNPFQTIEREDVGLRLKVKPQINEGDTIKLELEQEVSNVNSTALVGAADITTSKRSITTTVLVEDGQTLVLGGLIDDQLTDVTEKVPLLGDIPGLGRLFQYNSKTKSKKNLMIFLHPVIMRDTEITDRISSVKYRQMRATRLPVLPGDSQLDQQAGQENRVDIPGISVNLKQTNTSDLPLIIPDSVLQPDRQLNLDSQDVEWIEMPDGSMLLKQ